ncbi:hypothetical protein AKO1_014190 [Acrasis kona]|uniref:Kinesin motor domain-containing protein n=1 Tax=Acrasis kona TaxID=1008807 RepID=A0AAW2Z0G5_9EUKA
MKGNQRRQVGTTQLNSDSSRSHAVFILNLQIKNEALGKVTEVSKMSIVDLAGCERANRTGADGERLKEAGGINKSLLVLGRCLTAIRSNQTTKKSKPIPIRESEVTRLFRNELLGDASVAMIVTVSSSMADSDETVNVMRYSAVAKDIKTSSKVDSRLRRVTQTPQHNLPVSSPFVNPKILPTVSALPSPRRAKPTIFTSLPKGAISNEAEVEALREQIKNLEDEVARNHKPINRVELENSIRREIAEKMAQQEKERARSYNEYIQSEIGSHEEQMERIQKHYFKELNRLRQECDDCDAQAQTWRGKCDELTMSNRELLDEINILEQRIESTKNIDSESHVNELKGLRENHIKLMNKAREDHEKIELSQKRQIIDLRNENTNLKEQLSQTSRLEFYNSQLEKEVNTHKDSVTKLENKISSLNVLTTTQSDRIHSLEQELKASSLQSDASIRNALQHAETSVSAMNAHLEQEMKINLDLNNQLKTIHSPKPRVNSPALVKVKNFLKRSLSSIASPDRISALKPSQPVRKSLKRNSGCLENDEADDQPAQVKKRKVTKSTQSRKKTENQDENVTLSPKKKIVTRGRLKLSSKSAHTKIQMESDDDSSEDEKKVVVKMKKKSEDAVVVDVVPEEEDAVVEKKAPAPPVATTTTTVIRRRKKIVQK